MKRRIITTSDGSKTIQIEEWQEQYHSKHGALQEALHVFIHAGFRHVIEKYEPSKLHILEFGFGTGLNAFLTLVKSLKEEIQVEYEGLENFPVSETELLELDYPAAIAPSKSDLYELMHRSSWGKPFQVTRNFRLKKTKIRFEAFKASNKYDLIYYDAFGHRVQPELWEKERFENCYACLKPGGCLVTYSSKGSVRRDMESIGFEVERLKGPPGKRHMLRATK